MRILTLIFITLLSFSFARVTDFYAETEAIKQILDQSIAEYEKGDNLRAKKLAEDAYFQHYENMEGTAARNVGRRAISMERKFTTLRRYYKEKVSIRKIKVLIDGLYFDLDEVTPIIQNGFHMKAEASDTTYDKNAAMLSAREAEKGRAAAADDIFARISGASADKKDENLEKNDTNLASNSRISQPQTPNIANDDVSAPISADADVAKLQSASAMNPKLQALHDNFSLKLDEAAIAFREQKFDEAKNLINSALFDDYRNSKVEIAINQHTTSGLDQKIQQALRQTIKQINDNNATEHDLRSNFEKVKEQFFDALLLIPQDEIAPIRVAGYEDNGNATKDYTSVADEIKLATDKLLSDYQNVSKMASIDELQSIYLDTFEASGMENRVGAMDTSLKLKIESLFTKGVALIKTDASKDELKANFDELNALVASAAEKTKTSTAWVLFLSAFGILLREGLEALIIVVAIVSFLIQSGNEKRLNIVYSAMFVGVFLSFVTAFVIYYMFRAYAGQFRELLEGITFLIAVALLLYVAFWMLHKASDKKWAKGLTDKAMSSISSGESKTLWISVFLAVFREGAETVLFYQAMLFDASTSADFGAIFGGFGVAVVVLVVLYFLLKSGAVKIPIKLFFTITSYIIFFLCVVFTGKGFAELIEGKIIIPTLMKTNLTQIPDLGIHPYYETIIPQIIVAVVIIAGIVATKFYEKKLIK